MLTQFAESIAIYLLSIYIYICMYVYIKIIPRGIEQINMYLDSIIIKE